MKYETNPIDEFHGLASRFGARDNVHKVREGEEKSVISNQYCKFEVRQQKFVIFKSIEARAIV